MGVECMGVDNASSAEVEMAGISWCRIAQSLSVMTAPPPAQALDRFATSFMLDVWKPIVATLLNGRSARAPRKHSGQGLAIEPNIHGRPEWKLLLSTMKALHRKRAGDVAGDDIYWRLRQALVLDGRFARWRKTALLGPLIR
jgi:hypothetical protein